MLLYILYLSMTSRAQILFSLPQSPSGLLTSILTAGTVSHSTYTKDIIMTIIITIIIIIIVIWRSHCLGNQCWTITKILLIFDEWTDYNLPPFAMSWVVAGVLLCKVFWLVAKSKKAIQKPVMIIPKSGSSSSFSYKGFFRPFVIQLQKVLSLKTVSCMFKMYIVLELLTSLLFTPFSLLAFFCVKPTLKNPSEFSNSKNEADTDGEWEMLLTAHSKPLYPKSPAGFHVQTLSFC